VFLGAAAFGLLGLARSFAATRQNAPSLDKALLADMSIAPIVGVIAFIDAGWPLSLGTAVSAATLLLVLAAGIARVRGGAPSTRLFLAATSLLCLAAIIYSPLGVKLLGVDPVSSGLIKGIVAIHFILLSLALAERINSMNMERILLVEMATMDEKTGLNNYRYFDSMLRKEVKRALRYRRPLSLLMIDLDNFKRINDENGHRAGDEALLAAGRVLRANSRDVDIVARFGGDEFAIVLPETTLAAGVEAAEKLRRTMEEASVSREGEPLRLTISIGVASIPVHAQDRDGLIEAADKALYIAKESGRNQVRVLPVAAGAHEDRS
jgi:diguanylate cyclase (GGDEF)-like protein